MILFRSWFDPLSVLGLLGIAAALFLLDRLGLWMERRGWIFYRKRKPSGLAPAAFLELQKMVEPTARHVLEIKREPRVELKQPTDGDPPSILP